MILSGFSYFKYNLGFVIFIYLASLKNFKNLIFSSVPFLIGWLMYSYITNSEPLRNLIEPILILEYFLSKGNHLPVTIFSFLSKVESLKYLAYLAPIILSFFVIYKLKNIEDDLFKLSIVSLTCLSFASHQLHDYILLFPLLIFSLKNFKLTMAKINILFILYFFFFLRILSFFFGFQPWDFPYGYFGYLNNFLTILVLFSNFKYFILNKMLNKL